MGGGKCSSVLQRHEYRKACKKLQFPEIKKQTISQSGGSAVGGNWQSHCLSGREGRVGWKCGKPVPEPLPPEEELVGGKVEGKRRVEGEAKR